MNNGEMTAEKDGQILLKINKEQLTGYGELYVYFHNFEANGEDVNSVVVGKDKNILILNPQWKYFWGANDYLVNASIDDDIVSIKFVDETNTLCLDRIELFWVGNENIEEKINNLKNNSLQDVVFSQDRIEGNIEVKNEGWLFMNIPYNTGWKVYDNGKRENFVKANIGFMAIKLTKGEHNIVLKYDPLWNKLGLCSTFIGMFVLIILASRSRVQNKDIIWS